MSKFFRVLSVAVLLIAVVLAIGACGGGDDVTGKWSDPTMNMTYEFKSDGSMVVAMPGIGEMTGTYETSGGKIEIDMMGEKVSAPYKIDGDTMTISPEGEAQVVLEREVERE
ncbi:MAG: hypothetical protein GX630_06715 [Actinobacteria bacterium]|nr:hypothetical protein [Actinomycetota bacterium]